MFSNYNDFKDALMDFHPEKVGYTYSDKHFGWINSVEDPAFKFTANDKFWTLWLTQKTPTAIGGANADEPLRVRDLLLRVNIIDIKEFTSEMREDPDIHYPENQ